MIIEDYSIEAAKGYILNELLYKGSKSVQYFTDGCNNQDRKEITAAINFLVEAKEITRRGALLKYNHAESN